MSTNFSPIKVSTVTAIGTISTIVNLDVFFEEFKIMDHELNEEGFVFIEYGRKNYDTMVKGFNDKKKQHKKKIRKCFDNQITIIFKMLLPNGIYKNINTKVFRNGNIQMTGLRDVNDGKRVIDMLIKSVKDIHLINGGVVEDINMIENAKYKVCLINSDFRIGMEIKRDKLNSIMQKRYRLFSSFEPCIYPGVKIQYCWNTDMKQNDDPLEGICRCKGFCGGKGNGIGDGNCKRITIAAFQSGCIIITGAQSYAQINDAYSYICKIIATHAEDIKKVLPPIPVTPPSTPSQTEEPKENKFKSPKTPKVKPNAVII
jgi:TATA-box binding protein (TBP) (component of TFIID and TFIIIB)